MPPTLSTSSKTFATFTSVSDAFSLTLTSGSAFWTVGQSFTGVISMVTVTVFPCLAPSKAR